MIMAGALDHPVLWLTVASIPPLFLAWRCAWRNDYKKALILLVIGGFLLRLGPSLDPFLHTWDERYHALVAKHMLLHPLLPTLYENPVLPEAPFSWTEGRIWLHKPPFTMWCMAASMRLFGVNEVAIRLPSLVVSTLGILICFAFARWFCGRRVGFIAAFLYAVHGAVIEFASGRCATDHVDTMFSFLIGAGIVLYQSSLRRNRWLLLLASGLALGSAILTKWLPALVILPVAAALSLAERPGAWRRTLADQVVLLITAALVAAPWTIYVKLRFPVIAHHESLMNVAHFTTALDGQGGGALYYFDRLRIAYGELIYLPCIWFLWRAFRSHKNIGRWAILIWWLVPYIFFSFAATKMAGYVLPSAIPVLTISALFWTVLERHIRSHANYKWLGILILVALIALPVRYCIERLKPFQDLSPSREAKQNLIARIGPDPAHTVVFGCKQQYEAMFYTDCIAYERPEDAATRDSLEKRGYRVLTIASDPER
jgi:4-amino-4-deoxy-L-arabinose transferase-like glycosyltransferase